MAEFSRWRDIVPNPCNKTVERRNIAAIRDAFQALDEQPDIPAGDGLVPFVVTGLPVDGALPIAVATRDGASWTFDQDKTGYDPSERIMTANMKQGNFGWCRLAPEIAEDAAEIIVLEGRIRFFTGELETTLQPDDTATATAEFQFGNYPNSKDLAQATGVIVHDRVEMLVGRPVGTKILAILDERQDEYVAIANPGGSGDTVLPFVVTQDGINGACLVNVVDRTETPWKFTIPKRALDPYYYALEANGDRINPVRGLFFRNMKVGHYGYCRELPDHPTGNDVVEIIHLEGRARFVTGTLTSTVSTWADLTVEYDFGAFPNSAPVTGSIQAFDRLGMMQNQQPGTKAMGVYDEDRDEYVLIGPQKFEVDQPQVMAQIEICDSVTSSCCMLLGVAHRMTGVQNDICGAQLCAEPVWITCENVNLLPNTDYLTSITDSYGANLANFCDWGRDTGLRHSCLGNELPVFTIRCPCEPCECPNDETDPDNNIYPDTIRAIYDPQPGAGGFTVCPFPNFDMKCVLADPMDPAGVPGPGVSYWWGEFTVNGFYPRYGDPYTNATDLSITHPVTGQPVTGIDTIYVVWVPNNLQDPCDVANYEYWIQIPGSGGDPDIWQKYSGPVEIISADTGQEMILDDRGFNILFPTTFKYGILGNCNDADAKMTLTTIYHIPFWASTDVDLCDNFTVSTQNIGNDNLTELPALPGDCCQMSRTATIDCLWGNPSLCPSPPTWPGDPNNTTLPDTAYKYHVTGGCLDCLDEWAIGESYPGIIEGGDATRGAIGWRINWSGVPQKVLC